MSETPKTILALDTAGPGCSAALWGRSAILAGRREFMARGQSERLVPMVLEVMTEAGEWVKRNKRAIFTTDRCAVGSSQIAGFTRSGKTLYVHVHSWPGTADLAVGGLRPALH